jgi:hypothetical protein
VKKNVEPRRHFKLQNKKEIFQKTRQKFLKQDTTSTSTVQQSKEVPEYEMPPLLDNIKEMKPLGQVSTIKYFFQSCVKVLNDPSFVKILKNILEICNIETKGKLEQKIVNHLHTRRRKSREFRMNANIRELNM